MRLLFSLLLSLIFNLGYAQQSWQWGIRGGGSASGYDETVVDMATDNSGNLYVLSTVNTSGFPTISGYSQAVGGYGGLDALVTSYSCSGTFRWKKVIGGGFNDGGYAIGTDTMGHIYVTGIAVQTPSPLNPVHFDQDTVQPYSVVKVFYLVQYDTLGNFKWLRQPGPDTITAIQGQVRFQPKDMLVNKNGEAEILCYLGKGKLSNSNVVVDSEGVYILKYSVSGNISGLIKPELSYRQFDENGFAATSLPSLRMIRTKTNKYVLAGTQNFSTSTPPNDPLVLGGQQVLHRMFVALFDSQWHFLWKKENTIQNGGAILYRPVEDINGNILLAGGGPPGDVFMGYNYVNILSSSTSALPTVYKIDTLGNLIFAKSISTNVNSSVSAVASTSDKIFLAGNFPGKLQIDNFTLTNPSNTGNDIYLASFNLQTGATLALDSLKGPVGYHDYASAMVSDNKGNVYLGGMLGASFQVGSTLIQSAGGEGDFFVAKFGSANCNTPMPLTLTSFTAALQNNNQVLCRWQTRQEYNTKEFIIQRSADGANFSNIGTVKASGNSNVVQSYSFIDPTPVPNSPLTTHHSLFYRLQMLDLDGSYTYSSIAKINLSASQALQVYPNPASGSVGISYKIAGNGSIEVYNSIGIKIHSATLSSNAGTLQLATAWWCRGIYHVILRENGKVIKSMQLIVVAP